MNPQEDPLFDGKLVEEVEPEEKKRKASKTDRLYAEMVLSDPFYREAVPHVRRMLSKEAWQKTLELDDMDIGEVCFGTARQHVPIIEGKLEATFKMLTGKEWEYVVNTVSRVEAQAIPVGQTLYRLAFGITKLNGNTFSVTDDDGRIVDKKVTATVEKLKKLPLNVLMLLHCHYEWFQARTNLLLEEGQLKNG